MGQVRHARPMQYARRNRQQGDVISEASDDLVSAPEELDNKGSKSTQSQSKPRGHPARTDSRSSPERRKAESSLKGAVHLCLGFSRHQTVPGPCTLLLRIQIWIRGTTYEVRFSLRLSL